jgi:hypothetical protein
MNIYKTDDNTFLAVGMSRRAAPIKMFTLEELGNLEDLEELESIQSLQSRVEQSEKDSKDHTFLEKKNYPK